MNTEISTWGGYAVHGDVKELDRIVESTGLINLDKEDIIKVISSDGEIFVTYGSNANLSEAFKEAFDRLPCKSLQINKLLIEFRYGIRQPDMAQISSISATLSEANADIAVMWGMISDESLGESNKVVLVASVKI